MTPCTCSPIPVRSSLEAEPGAELVHVQDDRGEWHAVAVPQFERVESGGVQVGETVYRQVLVTPAAIEQATIDAENAAAQVAAAAEEQASRLAGAAGLPGQLLAALVLRAWPDATAAEREWAVAVIAAAGQRVREARA